MLRRLCLFSFSSGSSVVGNAFDWKGISLQHRRREAHVDASVLEHSDKNAKDGPQGAEQTSDVSEKVHDAIDLALDCLPRQADFVGDGVPVLVFVGKQSAT